MQSFDNEIDRQMFPDAEIVSVCAIFPDNVKLIIVCVYLPPNLSTDLFGQSMQCIERICASSSESILIVGDFNLPDIDWKDFTSPETVKNKGLLDLCATNGLNQYVFEPTRLTNILDLVFCNDPMLISDIKVSVPFGLSDHNSIVVGY